MSLLCVLNLLQHMNQTALLFHRRQHKFKISQTRPVGARAQTACRGSDRMFKEHIGLANERQQVRQQRIGILAFQHVDVTRAHAGKISYGHLALECASAFPNNTCPGLNTLVNVTPSDTLPQVRESANLRAPDVPSLRNRSTPSVSGSAQRALDSRTTSPNLTLRQSGLLELILHCCSTQERGGITKKFCVWASLLAPSIRI